MLKDTIERDRGIDLDGCQRSCSHDVITQSNEFPDLEKSQLLDLHLAHVQMESLPFDRRMSAKGHLQRIALAAGGRLRSEIFAGLIRQAIDLANSDAGED